VSTQKQPSSRDRQTAVVRAKRTSERESPWPWRVRSTASLGQEDGGQGIGAVALGGPGQMRAPDLGRAQGDIADDGPGLGVADHAGA
jgi:hypothetical protein